MLIGFTWVPLALGSYRLSHHGLLALSFNLSLILGILMRGALWRAEHGFRYLFMRDRYEAQLVLSIIVVGALCSLLSRWAARADRD